MQPQFVAFAAGSPASRSLGGIVERVRVSRPPKLHAAKATTPIRRLPAGDLFEGVQWMRSASPQPNFHLAHRENSDVVLCLQVSGDFLVRQMGDPQH